MEVRNPELVFATAELEETILSTDIKKISQLLHRNSFNYVSR